MVSRHHHKNVVVMDALVFQIAIEHQGIERVPIIKPEGRSTQDHVEVVVVALRVLFGHSCHEQIHQRDDRFYNKACHLL